MRNPTKAELKKFRDACEALNELGQAGFYLYLAMDSMNLMTGPSHDIDGKMQQQKSKAACLIENSGGGDW